MLDLNLGSLRDIFAFRRTVCVSVCVYMIKESMEKKIILKNRNSIICMYSISHLLV